MDPLGDRIPAPRPALSADEPEKSMNEDQDPSEELPETDEAESTTEAEAEAEEEATPEPAQENDEPESERGFFGSFAMLLLFFPFTAFGPLVRDRRAGIFGLLGFILLWPLLLFLWVYMYATPVVCYMSYNLGESSTARVERPRGDLPVGVAYVDALIGCYEQHMTHWMVNDRIAPTILLDNPQNFQKGVRQGMLYGLRVLRDNLSRQRGTDVIDPDVDVAFQKFNISPEAWYLPSAEGEYRKGIEALRRYRERLINGKAPFHPRADNFAELLTSFNNLTGGANTRLLNCIPDVRERYSEETMGDPTSSGESVISTRVAWSEVDDHFYYSRGVALVFRDVMAAVNQDFSEILEQRNAQELSKGMVVDFLDVAQFEPIYVARGSFDSLWANHPFKLLALLSQVRERSRSLHTMVAIDVR